MPDIKIVHTTQYRYDNPVRFTTHRLMLRPRDSHDLVLSDAVLGITPPAEILRWAHDVFGNSICYLEFGDVTSDTLRIVSTLELRHFPSGLGQPEATIDPGAETYPFKYDPTEFPDLASCLERHYPDPDGVIDAWAAKFVPLEGSIRTIDLLTSMTTAIQAHFTYAGREAEGTNSPVSTLQTGTGACRDLALLMMEGVRSLGFAARFVSGYLYDATLERPDGDEVDTMVGGGATHAWCSVYLPGAGWVEFDPTNGLMAGRNLIRVCSARTPEQAIPVAGSYIGKPTDFNGLVVDVAIMVHRKLPELPAVSASPETAPSEIAPITEAHLGAEAVPAAHEPLAVR